ncbi:hypothetical protein [Oceanobacillus salinisoli]|uniref:hypothetical protein n=1 Tax=Oceanobacillus salinisoli TaxID=2678611 RepID=UPI0012E1C14C|nr:hypothetical protein [Oceanobacillus salinisoli]
MESEQWFSKEQLSRMSVPTMKRVSNLLEDGDYKNAIKLAKRYKMEWSFLRKLMADSTIGLLEYIHVNFKGERDNALKEIISKVWKPAFVSVEGELRQKVSNDLTKRWQSMGVDIHDLDFQQNFSKELLDEITIPKKYETFLEKLEKDDADAKQLCHEVDHEWGIIHDLLVESVAALFTFIGERFGEKEVGKAIEVLTGEGWKESFEQINERDRKSVVLALAATWRAHSTGEVGPEAGSFTVEEDEEKFTFSLDPCGSGQRLVRRGYYDEPAKLGKTKKAHPWSFNRENFPYYCAHCTYMNEILPMKWSGTPVYPLDPPDDFSNPCTWYFYKNAEDAPERFYERYGFDKEKMLNKVKKKITPKSIK